MLEEWRLPVTTCGMYDRSTCDTLPDVCFCIHKLNSVTLSLFRSRRRLSTSTTVLPQRQVRVVDGRSNGNKLPTTATHFSLSTVSSVVPTGHKEDLDELNTQLQAASDVCVCVDYHPTFGVPGDGSKARFRLRLVILSVSLSFFFSSLSISFSSRLSLAFTVSLFPRLFLLLFLSVSHGLSLRLPFSLCLHLSVSHSPSLSVRLSFPFAVSPTLPLCLSPCLSSSLFSSLSPLSLSVFLSLCGCYYLTSLHLLLL